MNKDSLSIPVGFVTIVLVAIEPSITAAQSPVTRLDRNNLLIYRDDQGHIQPVNSLADWQKRRASVLAGMQQVMGPLPGNEKRCPLDLKVERETDCGSFVRRLITYASEPGGRVPAYLLVPKQALNGKEQAAAVLCLHPTDHKLGHKVVVGLGGRPNRQYAEQLAERGYVTLAPSYPLLAGYQPNLEKLGWQSGTMKAIWDNIRGIDLLESLPFVKPGGVGAVGHSLGGHNAVYTAAFDERIRVVVSSCGLDSYLDYQGTADPWTAGRGWTQQRYIPKLAEYKGRLAEIPFDFHEIVGVLAPRDCFINAPLKDANFQWDSVARVAKAASQVYRLHGVPERLRVEHPDGGHDFPDDMRQIAYQLFDAVLHRPAAQRDDPLLRVVDLDIGKSQHVKLCDGTTATVKLLDLKEIRDDIRGAIRVAQVQVEINGELVTLNSGNYHLPVTVGGVQIDCPITRGYYENTQSDAWGLDTEKAARLRLWPAGWPLIKPGTFIRPVEQRWFASRTWMSNQPVDGGSRVTRNIYYHSGLDIGGAEGLVEVIAATDGLVVSSGTDVLEEHSIDTPVNSRYDVVYIMDRRGWYYRYSHLKEIDETIKPGRIINQGDRIGVLGKEGGSGGWSHLHFEIKSRQPSGKWGTQDGYAFLWEAYQKQYKPKLIAVARPSHLTRVGETVVLDGRRSWSAGGKIPHYKWIGGDGTIESGVRVERTYARAGTYSEILKITDPNGSVDYDFTNVLVIDDHEPDQFPPYIHAAYFPTFGIKTGDPVTFKVRSFNITEGHETWDFADGSPPVQVHSDGNVDQHAKDGYAVTTHRFKKPGDYVVRVERSNDDGVRAVGHLHVRVAMDE